MCCLCKNEKKEPFEHLSNEVAQIGRVELRIESWRRVLHNIGKQLRCENQLWKKNRTYSDRDKSWLIS